MDILEDVLEENTKKYPDLKYGFDFKSKFKLIDTRKGFHVIFTYLFKRGVTAEELSFLENDFLKKTIDVNDVSGLELSDFNMNKVYTALFTLYYYDDDTFDFFLHHSIK
jgi:transposase